MTLASFNSDDRKTFLFSDGDTDHEISVYSFGSDIWFDAKDVCDVLSMTNGRQSVSRLKDHEKISVTVRDGNQGNPNRTLISESGFYRLVLRSNKPKAEKFQLHVTKEILPSIRKTGKYEVGQNSDLPTIINSDFMARIAEKMKQDEEEIKKLNEINEEVVEENEELKDEINEIKPILEDLLYNDSLVTHTTLASKFGLSCQEFHKILKHCGVLKRINKHWMFTQKHVKAERPNLLEQMVYDSVPIKNGGFKKLPIVKFTTAGVVYIYKNWENWITKYSQE